MEVKMRMTSRGRVTIPKAIREAAGMLPGTEVDIECKGDEVRIVLKIDGPRPARRSRGLARPAGHGKAPDRS